ncbi:MAG: hypothetical protein HYV32_04175 [Candidatus Kerfeldbacteria bacterium]|nr:hypothetical protein [Candidatus Kerfeldbacteria bacterium]
MMKRMLTMSIWILTLLITAVLSIAFFGSSNFFARAINIPLVLGFSFIIFRYPYRGYVVLAVLFYIVDLHSALPFGMMLSAGLLAGWGIVFVQQNILKNFALYSVVLYTLIGTALYYLLLMVMILCAQQLHILQSGTVDWHTFIVTAATQMVVHSVLLVTVFLFVKFFHHRLLHHSS